MNSLGLEYGSSSDEEDERARPSPPPETQPVASPAPAPSTAKASVVKLTVKSDEAPDKPSDKATEPVESAVTTEPDASMDDGDEEAMLLRAGIPPPAAPLADESETQQRIERFLRVQRERGQDFQTTLQGKKEVRNPYILEKVVEYFGIDELQSNFSPDVFDPHGMPLHEYADALALEQKKRADARAQRQLQQQRGGADPRRIQFASANPTNHAG
ncbi:SAP30-binding protein [Phytophthora pseudosyringae]|uniref:SAP30-binding protein n=1 Tax=Phytophthora pseudosyringae TaxID=221518 RepID=A0A8T1W8E9_9STRA|nr:SAP30-binding protein [Phytophthora pseudosyringae]